MLITEHKQVSILSSTVRLFYWTRPARMILKSVLDTSNTDHYDKKPPLPLILVLVSNYYYLFYCKKYSTLFALDLHLKLTGKLRNIKDYCCHNPICNIVLCKGSGLSLLKYTPDCPLSAPFQSFMFSCQEKNLMPFLTAYLEHCYIQLFSFASVFFGNNSSK